MFQQEVHRSVEVMDPDLLRVAQVDVLLDPLLDGPFGGGGQGAARHQGEQGPLHRGGEGQILKGALQGFFEPQTFSQAAQHPGAAPGAAVVELERALGGSRRGKPLLRGEEAGQASH